MKRRQLLASALVAPFIQMRGLAMSLRLAKSGDLFEYPVGPQPSQIVPALGDDTYVTLFNQDTANVVRISYRNSGAPSVGIQPLTSGVFAADRNIYASAPLGTKSVAVLPGMGSNLSASPAQIQQALQPFITPAALTSVGPQITLIHTVGPLGARVWGISLSVSITSAAAFVAAPTHIFTSLDSAAKGTLDIVEAAIETPSSQDSGNKSIAFGTPIPLTAGDVIDADVNGGTSIPNTTIRGSVIMQFSEP